MNKAIEVGHQVRQAYVNFVIYGDPLVDGWNNISVDQSQMVYDHTSIIKPIDLNEVCQLFENEVYA